MSAQLLHRLFGIGYGLSVNPDGSLHCVPPTDRVPPEIIEAIRAEKPAIIEALSPCPKEHPNPLGWYAIAHFYEQAAIVRDLATEGTDIHTAAVESCALLQAYDLALWQGIDQGKEWARLNGSRMRELSEVCAGTRTYEPMLEGQELIDAANEIFSPDQAKEAA